MTEMAFLGEFDTSNTTNMSYMFSRTRSLKEIDLDWLDTSKVKDMSNMFKSMISLKDLDLSGFDTSEVVNMDGMFNDMRGLKSLDVSSLDTSNVTKMDSLFATMTDLEYLDVSELDTSNVTSMSRMFTGTRSLKSLNVSGLDTSKVTDMSFMFDGASSLEFIDLSYFDTRNVTNMFNMFNNAVNLESLDLSRFDISNVEVMLGMFSNTKLDKLVLSDTFRFFDRPGLGDPQQIDSYDSTGKWIREDGKSKAYSTADFMNQYGTGELTAGTYVAEKLRWGTSPYGLDKQSGALKIGPGTIGEFNTSPWNRDDEYRISNEAVTKIDIADKVKTPVKSAKLFSDLPSLKEFTISGEFDTSKSLDMSGLFLGDGNLENVDVRSFDTNNVTDMSEMFSGTKNLRELDISSFNTRKTTKMTKMFNDMSLNELILGDEFLFFSDAALGTPLPNGADYVTGDWIRKDGKSEGFSPVEFMKNYGTGNLTAGAYVAEEFNKSDLDLKVSFNKKSEDAEVDDDLTTTFTIKHSADSSADSVAKNLALDLTDFTLHSALELPKKVKVETYNNEDKVISSEEQEIKHLKLADLVYGNYYKITLKGHLWNNNPLEKENYAVKLDFNDGGFDRSVEVDGLFKVSSGDLGFAETPEELVFKKTKLSWNLKDKIIERNDPDWSLELEDYRGTAKDTIDDTGELTAPRQDWEITATTTGFKDSDGNKIGPETLAVAYVKYGKLTELTENQETVIESHKVKNETPKEDHDVSVSWEKDGLKAIVHNRNGLNTDTDYTAQIDFDLRQAP